jgi:hypothetical protein
MSNEISQLCCDEAIIRLGVRLGVSPGARRALSLRQLFEIISSFLQLQSCGAPFRTDFFFSPRRVIVQDYCIRADP